MNFYEFYQLLNENTVSQEIKSIYTKHGFTSQDIGKIIDNIVSALRAETRYFDNINDNSKKALAKWLLYTTLKKGEAPNTSHLSQIPRYVNLGRIFLGTMADFLTAKTDQNGNLDPQLISKLNNTLFTSDDLSNLNREYHEELRNKQRNKPGRVGKTVISFPNGYQWVDLERKYCEIESETMGHCGNAGGRETDTILSLRDEKNKPHLTFILNNGMLGEMKGKGNDKPSSRYHPYIIELLKSPIITRVRGGGYKPENNFELSDLKANELEELLRIKPKFENDILYEKLTKGIKSRNYLTEDEVLKLANDEDEQIRLELIDYLGWRGNNSYNQYNDQFKNKIFKKLSKDNSQFVRSEVAYITNDDEILEELSNDKNEGVRAKVAQNKNTPSKILDKLADDKIIVVLERVAENRNTLGSTLSKLSKSKIRVVRRLVAANLNTPIQTLIAMLNDESEVARKIARDRITTSPNAPVKTLEAIVNDLYSININNIDAHAAMRRSELLLQVVDNPNVSSDILSIILNHCLEEKDKFGGDLLLKVMQHPKTPIKSLELVRDSDLFVFSRKIASKILHDRTKGVE